MGLPCRVDCGQSFAPLRGDTTEALRDAALERDGHELTVHGYVHPVISPLVTDARPKKRSPWTSTEAGQRLNGGFKGFSNTPASAQRREAFLMIREAERAMRVG